MHNRLPRLHSGCAVRDWRRHTSNLARDRLTRLHSGSAVRDWRRHTSDLARDLQTKVPLRGHGRLEVGDNATLPLENTSTRRPQGVQFFLIARMLTPNEFANVRRSALFIFCTSLAAMPAALAPAFSAILPDAGGVTWAWLELAEPGSTVSALKVCGSAGPHEADRTATPELAEPGSPACARERSC